MTNKFRCIQIDMRKLQLIVLKCLNFMLRYCVNLIKFSNTYYSIWLAELKKYLIYYELDLVSQPGDINLICIWKYQIETNLGLHHQLSNITASWRVSKSNYSVDYQKKKKLVVVNPQPTRWSLIQLEFGSK